MYGPRRSQARPIVWEGWEAHWDRGCKGERVRWTQKCVAAHARASSAVPKAWRCRCRPGMQGLGGVPGTNGRGRPRRRCCSSSPTWRRRCRRRRWPWCSSSSWRSSRPRPPPPAALRSQHHGQPCRQHRRERPPAPAVLGLPWRCGGRGASAGLTAQAGLGGRRRARAVEDRLTRMSQGLHSHTMCVIQFANGRFSILSFFHRIQTCN